VGITTKQELVEKISKDGALALTVEIRNANPDISTEKIIKTLKENNRNIEYQKLQEQGLAAEVIAKLKQLPFSPVAVEQFVELPDPDIFPIQATEAALELLNQDKLHKLNRKLKLRGQTALSMDDFLALQHAFSQVDMVHNFGKLDQQFQNIIALDTMDQTAGRIKPRQISKRLTKAIPQGYTLVNAIDELKLSGNVGDVPFGGNSCMMSRLPNLPMNIAIPTGPVDSPLVSSEGDDAIVSFPETGIAVIVSSQQATIIDSDGNELTSGSSSDTLVYYLPITHANRCKPYRFSGASQAYSVTLVDMIKEERLTHHVLSDGQEYLSNGKAAELYNSNTMFNAKSYTFSTINSKLSDLAIRFDLDFDDESYALFSYILYSPAGTVYTGTQEGLLQNLSRESGIWRLDIIPENCVSISSNTIDGLTPADVDPFNKKILNVTALINTDMAVQTKEFILGIVKNISLKTQGESSPFDEGEVTIDMNTTMSPKLLIPSYIDDIIERNDVMNDTVALWQCWRNSEKTGYEFSTSGSCFNYREEFLRRQELYESLHTYDYQNDPRTYACPDEDGMQDTCIRGELGPYNMANPTDAYKAQVVMSDFSQTMQRQYQDVEYLNMLSNYYDLYQNWRERTVQVDTGQFPYDGFPYKTQEFTGCDAEDTACIASALTGSYPRIPVIMPTHRPIFGVPLDQLKDSTLPITFDYTASDQDVYDTNAANMAFLSFLASQTFNIVTGNFVGLMCGTIDLTDDLHDVESAAQDDPLGSARVSINRYSSSDPFYGLHNQDAFSFFMSGVPEKNTQVDTQGQKLNYAQIACGLADLTSSGLQFAQNADLILNLDYELLGSAADIYQIIGGTSLAINSALIMAEAEDIFDLIQAGDIEEAKQRMKTSSSINTLNQGQDLFDNLDSLLNEYEAVGSSGNGNNVLKSSARYLLGTNKKTRAEVEFQRVSSVPVASISVSLDRVKIISNYEDDDHAEIRLLPFVGVVSDKPCVGENLKTLFSESEAIIDGDHPWDYLRFNDVADGQTLETPNTVLYSGGGYNAAAIYVELSVMEDDSLSLEDDDMIGVFSQTILFEELFNTEAELKWTFVSGSDYELVISDYPIYNSSNQLSLENPLSEDFERQKAHNRNRRPSALVSLTLRLTLGDISILHPIVDTSLDLGVMGNGRDTYSMTMRKLGEIDISGSIQDVFKGKAIVASIYDRMLTGDLVAYGSDPYYLINRFTYDVSTFTGDLLPIKEALTASKSIGTPFRNALNEVVKPLPLIQLLPDNRLLFAISHDDGARLMIVSYTDEGVMTLENSLLIKDAEDNQVYSLLNARLSPNRTRLMVPYVPTDYAGTDKTNPAYTKLNLYEINGDAITHLSSNAFGAGAPLTNIEFIDESHVVMLTRKLVFGDGGDAWWPDWEAVQDSCTSTDLDCLFELVDKNLLLFNINGSDRLELTDTLDIFYSPSYDVYLKDYYPLNRTLTLNDSYNDVQLVSTIDGYSSIIRLGLRFYQLSFDVPTQAYYFEDSSSSQNVKSLRYNPEGEYYCADGITCSGYLRSALRPSRDDTNVYQSEERIRTFEFADTDRDLVLAIVGTKLQLLSLYDGAAYKGPQIIGDIFDTEVSVNSADSMAFSFSVTDRDTPLDQLTVTVTATTVEAPVAYTDTVISTISFSANENGGYDWTGTIDTGAFDTESVLNQTIVVHISDGTYTTEKEFTILHKPSIVIPFADKVHGIEVWRTDGIDAGTEMITDVNIGTGDSLYVSSGLYRSENLYYYVGDKGDGEQPFVTSADGEAIPLKDGITGGAYTQFMAFGDYVYFRTTGSSGDSILWQTDGTSAGTVELKTISSGQIGQFFNVNNALYFFVNGKSAGADELWKSDGTSSGTEIVKGSLYYDYSAAISNQTFFFAARAFDGSQIGLWVSDGTTAGTQLLKEFSSIPTKLIDVDGLLYFQHGYQTTDAGNNTITHMDLWKTDGSDIGTLLVKEDSKQGLFDLKQMFVCDNNLYFVKDDVLWHSDGTEGGTVEVKTLYTLPDYNQLRTPVKVVNNTIYFNIQHYTTQVEYRIYALHPSTSNVFIEVDTTPYDNITFYNETMENNLIYSTQDADHYYLWKHNIDSGTILIKTTDK